MDVTEVTIIHHVAVVLFALWLLSVFNSCHPFFYFVSLVYLFMIHDRYIVRLRRKVQYEERRSASQKRVLSDSESVRWLNHAIEKIWPVCMEELVSQRFLLPIVPWFLQKYKPWTVTDASVQQLYLGRAPPMFTEMRVVQSTDDDHLVLELGLNFRTAEDMSAILAVKLRKRLGFGMWAKLHLTGLHIEGKVLVGVKFLHKWPFISRLRLCFAEPPYFQMTVKPIFSHGLDVTELPGIAGWLDKLLNLAFEETLVEPNMLVVDVEKFVSPEPETWFSVDEKEPIAYVLVEVVEASDMKPSDLNGLADPYVKGQLGAYRFRTKIQKKTLSPKWHEEFKIPISTWDAPNVLSIEVRDKDTFVDDSLGDCSISISDFRDGERHDLWLPLQNVKIGRLRLALRVLESNQQDKDNHPSNAEISNSENLESSFAVDTPKKSSLPDDMMGKLPKVADKFEPIDIEGQKETGIWVHHPGAEVPQKWEPRKGKNRIAENTIQEGGSVKSPESRSYQNDSSSADESLEGNKPGRKHSFRRGLQNITSVFHRHHKKDINKVGSFDESIPSPHPNLKPVNTRGIGVNFVLEDNRLSSASAQSSNDEERENPEDDNQESPSKRNVKGVAKSIIKHAGKSARNIKHTLSGKGSEKHEDGPGLVADDGGSSLKSDSSHEDSLPPH